MMQLMQKAMPARAAEELQEGVRVNSDVVRHMMSEKMERLASLMGKMHQDGSFAEDSGMDLDTFDDVQIDLDEEGSSMSMDASALKDLMRTRLTEKLLMMTE